MNQTQAVITSFDKSPLVQIFVWITLAVSVLGVAARVSTKLAVLGKLKWDDYLICVALVFSIGQSVAVGIQCASGFGQHLDTLDEDSEEAMLKAEYAAGVLFVASLCFSKMSITVFIIELTPVRLYRRAAYFLGFFVTVWGVSSIFAASFQCNPGKPWDFINGSCFNPSFLEFCCCNKHRHRL